MSVKMSDALRESINDINEILYAQKLIDKKEYERVSAQFSMAAVSTEMDGRQFAQIRRKLIYLRRRWGRSWVHQFPLFQNGNAGKIQ